MKYILSTLALLFVLGLAISRLANRANNVITNSKNLESQKKMEKAIVTDNALVSMKLSAHNWTGIYTTGQDEFLSEIKFNNNQSGTFTIYLSEDLNEGCKIVHPLTWNTNTNAFTMNQASYIQLSSAGPPMLSKCESQLTLDQAAQQYQLPDRLVAEKNYQTSGIKIEGYAKKETSKSSTASNSSIPKANAKEMLAFRKAERELVAIFEKHPGGLSRPQFTINDQTGEVTVNIFNADHLLGTISIEKEGFLFIPTQWEDEEERHRSSGTWKNIKYLNKDGKEITGDLDFCYNGQQEHKFTFTDTPERLRK